MKKFAILILSFFVLVSAGNSQPGSKLTDKQISCLKKGNRHEKNGWTYLHIEGAPRERGFQHGYLMAAEIKENIRLLRARWEYQTAMEWSYYVQKAGEILTRKVDAENLEEIDGIVEGLLAAGVQSSRDELVGLNGYPELIGSWWPTVKDSLHSHSSEPPKESCSSFIANGRMTADGKIVLGHNTMDLYHNPLCNLVLDILPEKGHRILMQSVAGFIHSETDFFITDAGLVGSETTIGEFYPFDPKGTPEFSRMRRATQDASSIDEWCSIMKKDNNGGYANAWLLGDINTNEIARLELGLKYIGFEKKKEGYFIGSNVAENLEILRFETTRDETNIKYSSIARRVRWKQLMKKYEGKINLKLAKDFESDHYDTYLNKNNPGGRTLCGHWETDAQEFGPGVPYSPEGTLDGKVVDAAMAKEMSFSARWGSACGRPFDGAKFLEEHPQYEWMEGLLPDRPSQPWTTFKAGEIK
ncbi:MAG TPA: C45 family peptidase [Prolixibacteraceae bacterium]|nr:C45 family peptidase [Prolixibacteraceae bacterium]